MKRRITKITSGIIALCLAIVGFVFGAQTPSQVMSSAAGFQAMSDRDLRVSSTFLLSQIAAASANPNTILANAAAFQSMSDRDLLIAQTYMLSTIVGSNWIGTINGIGTNLTTFGLTNYYDPSAPGTLANTNGPTTTFKVPGAIPLLQNDTFLGTAAAYRESYSQSSIGDSVFGSLVIDTTHNGTPPSGPNTEWVWSTPSHIALLVGMGNPVSGHLQFGPLASGFSGYGGFNPWIYLLQAQSLSQSSATGFSYAIGFQTSELQGANQVDHIPAILAYSIRTNAPGRYAMLFTTSLQGASGGIDLWHPGWSKQHPVMEVTGGEVDRLVMYKPMVSFTNLGTAAIDCSIPVSDFSTAVNVTFTAPVNFDPWGITYEHVYQIITNSAAGTITLTAPANARLTGTTTVTRMCQVEWWIKIGKWTNGVVTQWF